MKVEIILILTQFMSDRLSIKSGLNEGGPFITDTNTLCAGSRYNSIDHIIEAIYHWFKYAVVGAALIIADGFISDHYREVKINKKHFETINVAGDVVAAQSIIVISHFNSLQLQDLAGPLRI